MKRDSFLQKITLCHIMKRKLDTVETQTAYFFVTH